MAKAITDGTKFKLDFEDFAGNSATQVTNLTANNTNRPKIDYTPPTLGAAIGIVSNGTGSAGGTMYAKAGNSVTLSVQGGEDLMTNGGLFDVTIGGTALQILLEQMQINGLLKLHQCQPKPKVFWL